MRTVFEYMVVDVLDSRVVRSNGHWQGEIESGEAGAVESCPSLHEYLTEAGAQGWELVAVDPKDVESAQLYFKRSHAPA